MTASWQITIDCGDPEVLVSFWAELLGYVPAPPPPGHRTWRDWYLSVGVGSDELGAGDCCDRLVDPTGSGPGIWFQIVPEPKTIKNRIHLDVFVGPTERRREPGRRDLVEARVAELIALGASRVSTGTEAAYVVLADPEGNEFCVA